MQVHYRAGAGNFGEFSPPFYTINYLGGNKRTKSGDARAPAAPANSAPMIMRVLQNIHLSNCKVAFIL